MAFLVKKLQLKDFRVFKEAEYTFDPHLTVIHGPNATGKTSIIEALQLTCEGVSFRRPRHEELICHGSPFARAELVACDGDRIREVSMHIEQNAREFIVNGKQHKNAREIAGVLPVIVFTPDNLRIVKDSAQTRRNEIDDLGCQLSSSFGRLKTEYNKTLAGRNKLLRDGHYKGDIFDAWTDQLIDLGIALYGHRRGLLERLTPHIVAQHKALDATCTLDINIASAWAGSNQKTEALKADLIQALAASRDDERARRITTVGPHRDDIEFLLDGHSARTFGSQGQQRTIALAWKLGQIEVVREVTGAKPLLLLDDVMSELDGSRRQALAERVGDIAQTVITTAHIEYFDANLLKRATQCFT